MNVNPCFTMNYGQNTMNYEIRNEPKTNPIYPLVAFGEAGSKPISKAKNAALRLFTVDSRLKIILEMYPIIW